MKLNYIDVGKGESKTEAFLQLSPIGKIPVLKDGSFVLTERYACVGLVLVRYSLSHTTSLVSHAIMTYLADKHGWLQWYPPDLTTRARV